MGSPGKRMTLREANVEARRRFGGTSYCESARGRRTLVIRRQRGDRAVNIVCNDAPGRPWPDIFRAWSFYAIRD